MVRPPTPTRRRGHKNRVPSSVAFHVTGLGTVAGLSRDKYPILGAIAFPRKTPQQPVFSPACTAGTINPPAPTDSAQAYARPKAGKILFLPTGGKDCTALVRPPLSPLRLAREQLTAHAMAGQGEHFSSSA